MIADQKEKEAKQESLIESQQKELENIKIQEQKRKNKLRRRNLKSRIKINKSNVINEASNIEIC